MANQALYGFHNLADAFGEALTETNVSVVDRAVAQAVAEHNRQINALTSLFAETTTEFKTRFKSVGQATRLQPMDENGRARPVRVTGYYDIGLPMQRAGIAWGANWLAEQKLKVGDIERETRAMLVADARWMRDHVLAALFANASWSFTDAERGALTILGLANADTQTYQLLSGSDAPATDDHYLGQAAAIADATNPFDNIYDELKEHPENDGEVVVLIPTANKAATEALAGYKSAHDPNLSKADNVSYLAGSGPGRETPGTIIGYVNKCWIAEWRSLPDDYLIGVTTGGERALRMRQEPEATLQGFKRIAEREDHPYREVQWLRNAGFGAWNRVGAVVQHVGDATYDIPVGYESPMP